MSNDLAIGTVDWNDDNDSGFDGSSTSWMKLEQGKNKIRIMGRPTRFYVNWVEKDGKRRKFNTPIGDPDLRRRLDDNDFKAKKRYLLTVLDRADTSASEHGTFKILDIGPQIYQGIKELVNMEEYGAVNKYDVYINRGPKGQSPLYSVIGLPKTELHPSLREQHKAFTSDLNIANIIKPADPKEIYDFLGWSAGSARFDSEPSTFADSDDSYSFD